ncbi:MAG: hypothetical protein A2504_00580 [Bdellovibrionales bacterium RIFOXYD12_FULL_39_22]|nr:MAG: hypothetical protein A2385_03200 [Bdellovibrionales bacterium RIFOXYB1_FULL_39_21]OFZ42665.1 MAG: hypothetical protein A2485_10105 [Bdellovibrionales bacterium RIFOXYC12_FULL_39_17]OFZ47067.1 MAG: hypothetical protein A2404_15190 [Bdellovibrionales bacterium RIFOXYC1_FULL_39_130]OFZ75315.1 MAG: hypothetical protein A2560_13965 [Bdellovibrionales bacterium RIFOXYD1_FULL_39_84]OFZ93266.1 MAG: hypothetical protein A2504_00580 [Bdellovibrionales bacterium RIFOXYD12_FULL_39_22]HLE10060.1 hy
MKIFFFASSIIFSSVIFADYQNTTCQSSAMSAAESISKINNFEIKNINCDEWTDKDRQNTPSGDVVTYFVDCNDGIYIRHYGYTPVDSYRVVVVENSSGCYVLSVNALKP